LLIPGSFHPPPRSLTENGIEDLVFADADEAILFSFGNEEKTVVGNHAFPQEMVSSARREPEEETVAVTTVFVEYIDLLLFAARLHGRCKDPEIVADRMDLVDIGNKFHRRQLSSFCFGIGIGSLLPRTLRFFLSSDSKSIAGSDENPDKRPIFFSPAVRVFRRRPG